MYMYFNVMIFLLTCDYFLVVLYELYTQVYFDILRRGTKIAHIGFVSQSVVSIFQNIPP